MKRFFVAAALGGSLLAMAACTVPQPGPNSERLDASGTYYERAVPSQPVNDSMRNSTVNTSADRTSGKYPVGNAGDSNPY
jgi:hypothetical protein